MQKLSTARRLCWASAVPIWPIDAPIDYSAPWKQDGLSPDDVYRKNLDAIHASDALIAFGENGASAGVGQELEWAIRLGIPILYLTADRVVSRQIQGQCRVA